MLAKTPGRIQKVDPPGGSIIYSIGALESRIGGFYFLDPPGSLGTGVLDSRMKGSTLWILPRSGTPSPGSDVSTQVSSSRIINGP